MMQTVMLIPKIAFFPFWILWKGYTGLWWAFDDEPAPKKAEVGQDRAFQAVDSRPPARPKPLGALRMGFAASLIGSMMMGLVTAVAADAGAFSKDVAGFAWLWATATLFVGSVWGIRRAQRRKKVGPAGRGPVGVAPTPGPTPDATPASGGPEAARGRWDRVCQGCGKAKEAALTAGSLAAAGCKGASKACGTAYRVAKPGVRFAWDRMALAWKRESERRGSAAA